MRSKEFFIRQTKLRKKINLNDRSGGGEEKPTEHQRTTIEYCYTKCQE